MQQCTSLLLDLFPRDSLDLARLNIMQAAHDLLLPGCIHVLITVASKLAIRLPASSARSFSGSAQSLLQQFMGFMRHK